MVAYEMPKKPFKISMATNIFTLKMTKNVLGLFLQNLSILHNEIVCW